VTDHESSEPLPSRDDAGAPVWRHCLRLAGLIQGIHGKSPDALAARRRRFGVWNISVGTGEHLTRTLLALSLHTLTVDTAAATGRPVSSAGLEETAFTTVVGVVTRHPHHNLLAGLPDPPYPGSPYVDVLRLLMYDSSGKSAVTLERLAQEVRTTLEALIGRFADPNLTCARLPGGDGTGSGDDQDLRMPGDT
jgi:hypothetical protein